MAKEYDNTNRGILFDNDRKEQETHPDYKGSINVDGKDYWISGWDKDTSKGEAISLSVTAKDARTPNAPPKREKPAQAPRREEKFDDDSDIPW